MAGFNVMDMLNKTSKEGIEEKPKAVSYTHLTLPTT